MDYDISLMMLGAFTGTSNTAGTGSASQGKNSTGGGSSSSGTRHRGALLLDRVMEDHPISRQASEGSSRLLALPAEILAEILDLLAGDARALGALALASSDCRQLARSRQFAAVRFDYSPWAQELARALADELAARVRDRDRGGPGAAPRPAIGACVRSFVMASTPNWLAAHNRPLFDSVWGTAAEAPLAPAPAPAAPSDASTAATSTATAAPSSASSPPSSAPSSTPSEPYRYRPGITQADRERLREDANRSYARARNVVQMVLGCGMPHLEAIEWRDAHPIDDVRFFRFLARSPARHLRLHRLAVDARAARAFVDVFAPLADAAAASGSASAVWPLRSLALDVRLTTKLPAAAARARGREPEPDPSPDAEPPGSLPDDAVLPRFFETFLRLCAPTLESLTWEHMHFRKGGAGDGPETLSLGSDDDDDKNANATQRPCLAFPRLTTLRLRWIDLSTAALGTLLRAPLRHLLLPPPPPQSTPTPAQLADAAPEDRLAAALDTAPLLRDLQTLVIPSLRLSRANAGRVARFVGRQAGGLARLSVAEPMEARGADARLDEFIVPLLAAGPDGGFVGLRSLSLAWGGGSVGADDGDGWGGGRAVRVPAASLRALGRLPALEQLSLRAGVSVGWRAQWLVDHDALRASLAGLTRLRRLALSRDTYAVVVSEEEEEEEGEQQEVEEYYTNRRVGAREFADAAARPELDGGGGCGDGNDDDDDDDDAVAYVADEDDGYMVRASLGRVWERAHRNRMLTEAERYAAALPSLEWAYLGQRPMEIVEEQEMEGGGERRKRARPTTRHRDDCYALLEEMFGMPAEA
ncbi:hypothetical protein GGS23DRAFT_597868 [Durotheca rogersii]|uniref:uncharacterized protein n=1 Tax=Durotheca rogersii TaxID=419775 RepID=UPI00221E3F5A|nr:uncharacterized protein GGS23DRAFT_597868 [Durotheca rogersii]KAI5862257.1 hypothetical protein GGS23DRAFT_597868 [Durotheca rogersii]